MLRLPILVAIALAIAFSGGIASSLYALKKFQGFDTITIGPWLARPDLQTARADPYAKAYRARQGDVLLGEAEGLVFTAGTDGAGRPLSGTCRYTISGSTPAARFWTLRATDPDGRPLDGNPALPHAFESHDVLRDSTGAFTIVASPRPVAGNWLAMDHEGPVRFVLTLLDTPTAGNAGLIKLQMPSIRRLGCASAETAPVQKGIS
ncbi:MAG TPA: DUF1214 domain-containing protein [Pararhizobium sp.]|nr:DUF1214 domain-containing protein [Pararhizobium sp.]